MRVLATAVVVALCAIAVGGTPPRISDLDREGLTGPIHTIEEAIAPFACVSGRSVEGKRTVASRSVYNQRGDEVERVRYASGAPVERVTIRYTTDGTQVCTVQVRSAVTTFSMVSFDATSPEAREPWVRSRRVVHYVLDSRGRPSETRCIDERVGRALAPVCESYIYDSAGRLVTTRRFSKVTGETLEDVEYAYMPCGKRSEMIVRHGAAVERRVVYDGYVVDAYGNWTRRVESEFTGDGRLRERRAVYRTIGYAAPEHAARTRRASGREASLSAKHRDEPRRSTDGLAALGSHKLKGRETAGMPGGEQTFFAVSFVSRYNEKKPENWSRTNRVATRVGAIEQTRARARIVRERRVSTERAVTEVDSDAETRARNADLRPSQTFDAQ